MAERPIERWGPGEPVKSDKLNVSLDRAVFDLHAGPGANISRSGNAATISVSEKLRNGLPFWALLTKEDPANAGRYAFHRLRAVDYTLAEFDPIRASSDPIDSKYTALEANLRTGMVGQRVLMYAMGYDTTLTPTQQLFRFIAPAVMTTGEFQWMLYATVSANQAGWDEARAVAVLEDGI